MVSLHQTEELEVIWRKGDHDLGGQQLHHSERWLWEKWITWDLKPEEQDLKQCFISGRCLDQRAVNWGFFSLPQTFLLELPFTIRCFSGLFYFSDSTVQQSRQELDCRHGQHSPCSLEDRNNPLRLQMWHSQGSIFWSNCSSPLLSRSWAEDKNSGVCGPGVREHGAAITPGSDPLHLSDLTKSWWNQSRSTSTGE